MRRASPTRVSRLIVHSLSPDVIAAVRRGAERHGLTQRDYILALITHDAIFGPVLTMSPAKIARVGTVITP